MKYLKLVAFTTLIFFFSKANGQFKLGLGGGINHATFSGASLGTIESVTGFNAGLITEIKLPIGLGFELDILYSTKGATYKVDEPLINIDSEYSLKYIDVPVVGKLYILKVINLQLGIQYSYLIGADLAIEGVGSSDAKETFKTSDVAAIIGFGVDVSKFHFSTRYTLGLTAIGSQGGENKNRMLTFTVGIWLKK